jgi:hypothetical protein
MSSVPYEQQVNSYSPAATAMWLGIGSLVGTTLGPCMCYMPFMLALPMALAALSIGWAPMQDPETPAMAQQMARAGFVAGLIALGYIVVLGLFIAAYFGLYFLMIFAIVLGA